ncbi:hypothetical protein B5F36_13760 [Anaerofilum sp. An201]|nr:DUF6751 family protein [Anaerofilum sp. An201]OUP00556.1 hypothetical protein B5F36_13760 [Anaerofilum sp. An201]
MLKADQTVTLIHRQGSRKESYLCTVIPCASWFWKHKAAVGDTGLRSARELHCRIPAQNLPPDLEVEPGDKILLGEMHSISGAEFAALGRTRQAAVVLDVHRNFFGPTPHLYILGG